MSPLAQPRSTSLPNTVYFDLHPRRHYSDSVDSNIQAAIGKVEDKIGT